jgi:hypothetical protein
VSSRDLSPHSIARDDALRRAGSRAGLVLVVVVMGAALPAVARADARARIERYAPARTALESLVGALSGEQPGSGGSEDAAHLVAVSKSREHHLKGAIEALGSGSTIGKCIRGLDRQLRGAKKELRALERNVDLSAGFLALADRVEPARQLRAEIAGLKLAADDLLAQARGLRGASLAVEAGVTAGIPLILSAGLRVGIQLNGPDTGRFPVKPYLRASGSVSLLVAGVRETVVAGAINGAYTTASVGPPGVKVELSPNDPTAGTKVSVGLLTGRVSMAGTRGLGADLSLPLPVSPIVAVFVEHDRLGSLRAKITNSRLITRLRAKSPLVDRVLSDKPPSLHELKALITKHR